MPWETAPRRKDPPGWKALRQTVIARAQEQCEYTPPGINNSNTYNRCSYQGRDVDHIINVAQGGSHELSNLQLLCEWHHKQKTQAEAKANRVSRTERHPGEKHPGLLGK
jgi:5-methylcytosine-specific restriction protein A|tara:strand:+ start:1673 stop:1999 length:327 start_codon:yes stop_codon:yes gene_type:complete